MCVKYFDGKLEGSSTIDKTAWLAGLDLGRLVGELKGLIGTFQYNVALQRIWNEVLDAANRYIDETKPFTLAKTDLEATKVVMVNLAESLRVIAILIKPFLPTTAVDVLPGVQLRGFSGLGLGWLRPCHPAARRARTPRHGRPGRRQAGTDLSQDRPEGGRCLILSVR